MAGSNVLKEFIVKLGFKLDESQFRRFREGLELTGKNAAALTKSFVKLGEASVLAGTAMGGALAVAAKQLENLYFASQRTGASAKELQEFAFAAEQVGVSAEAAQGSIEALAAARRTNPGLNGILAGFGIDPRQTDNAKVMVQLLAKLHSMPHFQGAQYAKLFGLDEATFNQLENNLPEMQKALALREKLFKATGVDPDKFDKQAHEFMMQFRLMKAGMLDFAEIIAVRLMPAGLQVIHWIEEFTGWMVRADHATGGWSSQVAGLVAALGGLSVAKGILGLFGGGTAAAGSGILSGIGGLLAPIAAGAVGIYELHEHKDAVEDWNRKFLAGIPSLSSFVAGFEGHAKNGYGVYKDIAGHLTAGFGHLVRPGEDFSKGLDKEGALALLTQDLKAAGESVKKLVHVALTGNQEKALTDFVINLGAGNLAKSTLLKDVNTGNFANVASDLARWNKVFKDGHYEVSQALVNRRAAEAAVFNTPDKRSVTITQKTDIHVEAGPDSRSTADEIARRQSRVNGDIVRNFAGATQ